LITEEIKEQNVINQKLIESKTFPWFRHIQESRNGIRKGLSILAEIKEMRQRHRI